MSEREGGFSLQKDMACWERRKGKEKKVEGQGRGGEEQGKGGGRVVVFLTMSKVQME